MGKIKTSNAYFDRPFTVGPVPSAIGNSQPPSDGFAAFGPVPKRPVPGANGLRLGLRSVCCDVGSVGLMKHTE